ncbi:hypothetical protein MMC31_004269 [Peltigera leucophlebia]|nr:hypothetical protein [Peltigera leucophlebia]
MPVTFLTLPVELRLQVYGHAFVPTEHDYSRRWASRNRATVSLLRTCKQVHSEAAPVLYSGMTFHLHVGPRALDFLHSIGPINKTYIKSLHIFFSNAPQIAVWIKLVHALNHEVKGLRQLRVVWETVYGAGKDPRFVCSLATICGLEALSIEGFYAKRWPEYLEKKMGLPVSVDGGQKDGSRKQRSSLLTLNFRDEFQKGTEDMYPEDAYGNPVDWRPQRVQKAKGR